MKKALILATGYSDALEPLVKFIPSPLFQVAGRPVLHYVCDFLIKERIKETYFILHHLPLLVEKKLQEGQRWGIKTTFFLCRTDKSPLATVIPSKLCQEEDMLIIGKADELPYFTESINKKETTLFYYPDHTWSGWGIVSTEALRHFPFDLSWEDIPNHLKNYKKVFCEKGIIANSLDNLLETNVSLINRELPAHLFATDAKMIAPNVWISRGVSLHPTAKLFPPLFIGRHTSIGKGCTIGPEAIIENYCVIDNDSSVKSSIIISHSYVGQGLNVNHSVAYHNLLVDLENGSSLHIQDDFILSELRVKNYLLMIYPWCERILAGIMILFLFPLMRNSTKKWVVKPSSISSGEHPELMEWHEGMGSLTHVLHGDAHFVGIKPRTLEELDLWTDPGKQLYKRTKLGLITEEDTIKKRSFEEDHSETLDSYYAVNHSFLFDIKLLLKWMGILR